MAEQTPGTGIEVLNDGACIRIVHNGKILLVAKEQIKTIDNAQADTVRMDLGEGPLRNIFLNYHAVAEPVVQSGDELREKIKAMLITDQFPGGYAKELTLQDVELILQKLVTLLENVYNAESRIHRIPPTIVDESNPNLIYRGWHGLTGDQFYHEWAIERITRIDDQEIREWVQGTTDRAFYWRERTEYGFMPLVYGSRTLLE